MTEKRETPRAGRQARRIRKIVLGCSFVLMLAALSGCAEIGNFFPKPTVQTHPETATEVEPDTGAPGNVPLDDGRIGFVIDEVPHNPAVWQADFNAAVDSLNVHDDAKAAELLEKVVGQEPGVTAPYIDLAIAYRRLGKSEQAETCLKKALDLIPAHPVASNEYGLLLRKSGRFTEARTIYEQALDRFPDYFPLHRNLGILCDLYLNDLECASNQYELYSKAQPDDEKVKLWLADLQQRLGQ